MNYEDYGISIPASKTAGEVYALCPQCSHTRKKSKDRCLGVNLDLQVWHCNHCGWKGSLKEPEPKKVDYVIPQWRNNTTLSDKAARFFADRRISAATLQKLQITESEQFFPQLGASAAAIEFNYFHEGQLLNVKYRGPQKSFMMHKGAQLLPYNLDSVKDAKEFWIVEGEMDCAALTECGVTACISVPNGATLGKINLSYLDAFMHLFDEKKIHIATDNDAPGRNLREQLADRFGRERCDYVTFGSHKDANDCLIMEGGLRTAEFAREFHDFPMEGIYTVFDFMPEVYDMFNHGLPKGAGIGVYKFDELLTFTKGYLTTITGIPSHGKSDFLDQILIGLMKTGGWKTAFYSPENRPTELHISKLIRKLTGRAFDKHKTSEAVIDQALHELEGNFYFIKPKQGFKLSDILQHVKMLVNRKGIDCFVIDSWNKLEHLDSSTDYIGKSLDEIVQFCEVNRVHCFLVAHPTKMRKDKDGMKYEVPTLYDISGSANFYNKTDNGITVYRDFTTNITTVHVQKVKFQHWGQTGSVYFRWDADSSRFSVADEVIYSTNEDQGYPQSWNI